MKAVQVLGGLLVVILLVALLGGSCALRGYNQAIALDEAVHSQWAQVENQLQRRYDLSPNLVETVKGVAEQEQKIFLGLAEARKAYFAAATGGAPINERIDAANRVEGALARLLIMPENYPQLRSNESFLKLQDSLEGTENRLAVERQRYNDTVRELNTYVRRMPGQFFASLAGVKAAEYFEPPAEAKERPRVDFSGLRDEPTEPKKPSPPPAGPSNEAR